MKPFGSLVNYFWIENNVESWGCGLGHDLVECLPSILEALALFPALKEKRKKRKHDNIEINNIRVSRTKFKRYREGHWIR